LRWVEDLFQGHTVIVGTTGSGKSNTLRFLARKAVEKGRRATILDWCGEHGLGFLTPFLPRIPFSDVRELLPTVLEETLRPSSGGISIGYAVTEGLEVAESWEELVVFLKTRALKRDMGAMAALRRLVPLYRRGVLVDGKLEEDLFSDTVLDLSNLPPFERRICLSMLLALIYSRAVSGVLGGDLCVFIDEAWQIHTGFEGMPVTLTMLMELRKYDVNVFAVYQEPLKQLLRYNMVVHTLGHQSRLEYFYSLFPAGVDKLRVGEAYVYTLNRRKWVKVKVPITKAEHVVNARVPRTTLLQEKKEGKVQYSKPSLEERIRRLEKEVEMLKKRLNLKC